MIYAVYACLTTTTDDQMLLCVCGGGFNSCSDLLPLYAAKKCRSLSIVATMPAVREYLSVFPPPVANTPITQTHSHSLTHSPCSGRGLLGVVFVESSTLMNLTDICLIEAFHLFSPVFIHFYTGKLFKFWKFRANGLREELREQLRIQFTAWK